MRNKQNVKVGGHRLMANFRSPKKGNRSRKGLSTLQREILSMARRKEGEVLARDVLIEYYGFRPFRNPEQLRAGAIGFSKPDIGIARYNSATVAIAKAFNRLADRGLVVRIIGGIRLEWSRQNG